MSMSAAPPPPGQGILQAALDLVLATLREHPRGLTNSELGKKTGLELDVLSHPGYVTYSLLSHLRLTERVVKEGRLYRLAKQADITVARSPG